MGGEEGTHPLPRGGEKWEGKKKKTPTTPHSLTPQTKDGRNKRGGGETRGEGREVRVSGGEDEIEGRKEGGIHPEKIQGGGRI